MIRVAGVLTGGMLALALVVVWPRRAAVSTSHVANADASAPAGSEMMTINNFLAGHLGPRWAGLRERLRCDANAGLEQLICPAELVPWEAAAPLIRQRLHELLLGHCDAWVRNYVDPGSEFDLQGPMLNPYHKELSDDNSRDIDSIVARYEPRLAELGMQAFNLLVMADQGMWDEGRIEACPFVWIDVGDPRARRGHAAIVQRYAHANWKVSYVVDSSEWPELDYMLGQILALRHEREHAVAAYIEGL